MKLNEILKALKNFAIYKLQAALVLSICLIATLNAQVFEMNGMPPPAMRLNYSEGSLSEGGTLVATITIPANWHVNANVAADEFLKPSSIDVKAEGIVFGDAEWPVAKEQYSEALDFVNKIFDGTFHVRIPVKSVADVYDSAGTVATFHYQACSNSICLAPASVTVQLSYEAKKKDEADQEPIGKETSGNSNEKFQIKIENLDAEGPQKDLVEDSVSENTTESINEIAPPETKESIAFMLLFAFIGGLILNLMPCVLPVLSLKLFSLIRQAGESKGRLMALGFSTVCGILVSFWVLAVVVVILRLGGGNPGWGMQFQSSGFVLAMVAVLTLFALSFFGIFEVWLPGQALTKMDGATRKEGLPGAFFTGALLVLLSTPCSAPFLGSAMGFAFNETAPVLFLFFTAAGLGLALPYLLVSVCPSLLKFLPKPGTWMVVLQKIMGVLLLGTVAWLLWISYRSYALSGIAFFGGIFLLNALFAVVLGKVAPPGSSFVKEILVFALIVILNIAAKIGFGDSLKTVTHVEEGYLAYSEESLEELRQKGITVFVDVTADWCITCKANEAAVLSNQSLNEFFKENNVQKIKADWTHGDENVTRLLKSFGKSGVPAYAVFSSKKGNKPVVLPEILTIEAIKEAVKSSK